VRNASGHSRARRLTLCGGFQPAGYADHFAFLSELGDLSGPYFQADANLSGIVVGKVNAGLLKGFLYFEDGPEVSFHDALVLFDAL
jgi:hypothetical protein